MNPTVRWMGPDDAAEYGRMAHALWPDHSALDLITDNADALSQTSQRQRSVIAIRDSRPVGFADARLRDYVDGADASPVMHLEGIWVDEAARGSGAAHAMLALIENWARELGLHEITSDAEIGNQASLRAHGRWGFRESGRIVQFHKRLD